MFTTDRKNDRQTTVCFFSQFSGRHSDDGNRPGVGVCYAESNGYEVLCESLFIAQGNSLHGEKLWDDLCSMSTGDVVAVIQDCTLAIYYLEGMGGGFKPMTVEQFTAWMNMPSRHRGHFRL
jgi:hypothetical protein